MVQVWPEGTIYGGIDEAGIDRIVREHLLDDSPVDALAYEANGRKHALRSRDGPDAATGATRVAVIAR